MTNPSWPETDLSDWNHVQTSKHQQNKMAAAMEIIRSSKQFRVLLDMGFKKTDIELALRATDLNMEEAIEILNQSRSTNNIDAWRRHDDHNAGGGNFDHNNFPQRFPTGPQAMPFPPVRIVFFCRVYVKLCNFLIKHNIFTLLNVSFLFSQIIQTF